MDLYINNLIDKLYKTYNFNIIEMKQQAGVYGKWAVYNKDGDTLNIMFFSVIESYRNIRVEDIIYNLRKSFENADIRLIQIVLDGNACIWGDNNSQLNHEIYPQCELILINPVLNQIMCCTNGAKKLANQISGVISYMKGDKSNNKDVNSKMEISKFIVTYIIIALNVMVYIITSYLSGNIFDSDLNVLVFMGAKVNSLIAGGQYYRLFNCMFLHAGIIHLGVNMYSLYIMGTFIEKVYGKFKYIIIYFISGIISSMTSYIFSPSISVGASGAIFGLLGAALVFALKMKQQMGKGFIMNILSVIIMNLIIGFSIANVDNFGHLGGLLGGISITYLLDKIK
ncbi:rhomboid family intramembrane serine protease [Clostridium sp. JNZ X4-2]